MSEELCVAASGSSSIQGASALWKAKFKQWDVPSASSVLYNEVVMDVIERC